MPLGAGRDGVGLGGAGRIAVRCCGVGWNGAPHSDATLQTPPLGEAGSVASELGGAGRNGASWRGVRLDGAVG